MTRALFFPVRLMKRLRRDRSGVAAIEFAYVLPMLVTLITGGAETTNYVWTRTQISSLALNTADHASRMGRANVLKNVPVTEGEINDVLIGTAMQGADVDILDKGRIIISSVQRNASGGQWIAWQRCYGNSTFASEWGKEGKGKTGTSFKGMGNVPVGASENEAIMFAEVAYEYEPLFPLFEQFVPEDRFRETAAFNVREHRDLSQIYPVSGVTPKKC